ncbi:ATP-binding protein [Streptomyces sp. XM4193]|uniref:ATP-binding protein n=1 Tax=Streptomyces sp. XM4193 TaxID=2929782 RepID=UPI001FFBFFBD|nr:ATP-binding protein [Streptomyces sp. XM4193]MCK1796234.1 ATP-binding protein [Streptomyces sp. XM4193]
MTTEASGPAYEPHPHLGGRGAALRALASWRSARPGTPRVVVVTGADGSGRSRLLDGFLMLCDPEFRRRLRLDVLDPATVPPELPAPLVLDPTGEPIHRVREQLAQAYRLPAAPTGDLFAQLAVLEDPLPLFVPHADRAGPVRHLDEETRLVREVLIPLAELPRTRIVLEAGRSAAAELVAALPEGEAGVIDLAEARWADPEGLVLQTLALMDTAPTGDPVPPYATDPALRRTVAEALVSRIGAGDGSRLTAELAVRSLTLLPIPVESPLDPSELPCTINELLDRHAARAGVDPATMRTVLTPIALAEGGALPAQLISPLASAAAGRDLRAEAERCLTVLDPFLSAVVDREREGEPSASVRLTHPALARAVREGMGEETAGVQGRIAVALLEAVPDQDWSRALPYVRDRIAAHALAAGLLPRLLTDPGLFTHADPVVLRACVEAVAADTLDAPARTYLRIAPRLTADGGVPPRTRARLLEAAFTEDGLPQHAAAVRALVA